MMLRTRKRLILKAVAAGTMLAGTVTALPVRAADDLPLVDDIHIDIPMPSLDDRGPPPRYGERPYEEPSYYERPYRPGPFGTGPYAAIPSARRERPLDARPMLPPAQVVTILRSTGYSPLGRITQRGWIYTVAALDPRGDDGRLIIDARTGRIMRFIPALAVNEQMNDRMTEVYGPPGPPPAADSRLYAGYESRRSSLLEFRHVPRPPVAVPKTAQRPVPKTARRTATPAPAGTAPSQQATAPSTERLSTEPPAAVKPIAAEKTGESKSARTTVGAATVPQPPMPAPPTLKLWPTQAMPDVQPLE